MCLLFGLRVFAATCALWPAIENELESQFYCRHIGDGLRCVILERKLCKVDMLQLMRQVFLFLYSFLVWSKFLLVIRVRVSTVQQQLQQANENE